MLLYCLKCRKNAENKKPQVTKTNKETTILLSKCRTCDSKSQDLSKNRKQKICYV